MLVAASLALQAGCEQAEITRYYVPKEPADESTRGSFTEPTGPPRPGRSLAAMVPHETDVWFFKVLGDSEDVGAQVESFKQFVKSVRISTQSDQPQWTMPDGWTEIPAERWRDKPGASMRFATLEIGGGKRPLELTVSSLKRPSGAWEPYVLINVNRWRRELGLKPLDEESLEEHIETIATIEGEATLLDSVGQIDAGRTMRPPFVAAAGRTPRSAPEELNYDVPDGWQPGPLEASRGGITLRYVAAFEVSDQQLRAEVTVSAFPVSLANPLRNVKRWRGQVGWKDEITAVELDEQFQELSVGDSTGRYIEIVGPDGLAQPETILAVIIEYGARVWFIKLRGDTQLAKREKGNFKSFVQSLKFSASGGGAHGGQ